MIEDLEALLPHFHQSIEQIAQSMADAGHADVMESAKAALGMSRGAMLRASIYFKTRVSADPEHVDGAGVAFTLSWCAAERETLRRVMAAITSPSAKGHEAEVVTAMMKGASVEEALALPNSAPAAPVTQEGRVVAFPARRVTDSADDETRAGGAVSTLGSRTEQESGRNDC